jgi:excisionase family DNA binding protein
MTEKENKVFTVDEIAHTYKVDRMSVYRWIYDGRLKSIKLGKSVRVTEKDLDEFLTKGK